MKRDAQFNLALITGATSGIGLALAELLAKKKIPLILTGRNAERRKIIACIEKTAPDLVINNAGLGFYNELINNSIDEEGLMVEVNIKALVELTLAGARTLIKAKKKGVIVNVSSLAGEFPCPGMATYGASKAFVTSFSKAADFELSPKGVRVLASAPGQVSTFFASRAARREGTVSKPSTAVMSASQAAFHIWKQIEARNPYSIFDFRNKLFFWLTKFLPERVVKNLIYKSIKQRL